MEAHTAGSAPEQESEKVKVFPPEVEAAATGRSLNGAEESKALEFLVGATYRDVQDVRVQFATPAGMLPLVFRVRAVDGRRLTELEKEHTEGDNPLTADADTIALSAAIVAESVEVIIDPSSGAKLDPHSERFCGDVPSTAIALEGRFKYQAGLLDGLAGQIRRISGWDPDRVGQASRAVVTASGN